MHSTDNVQGFQYMKELGVSATDVEWMESKIGRGGVLSAQDSARRKRIEDEATEKLFATITPHSSAVRMQ